ncbi:hypothetical protein Ciccas_005680 [Cichlidogyrus casuarinus]|uniref:Uncharacterized protein n=1 Tax=Cichlidogyrus casuarinus TaxID=1844966 RepID=A0ABD2Q7Y9_9PLAT
MSEKNSNELIEDDDVIEDQTKTPSPLEDMDSPQNDSEINSEFGLDKRSILIATPFSNVASRNDNQATTDDEESMREDEEDEPHIDTYNTKNSPAFISLDNLHRTGAITGAFASSLRMKYLKLCESLDNSRNGENQLLHDSKLNLKTIELQKKELARNVHYPEGFDSNADKLREQLLRAENSLLQIEYRIDSLSFEIRMLVEEKKMFEREYSKLPNLNDYEDKRRNLDKEISAITVDISRKSNENRNLIQSLRELRETNQGERSELNDNKTELTKLKEKLDAVEGVPLQHVKEIDKLAKQKTEVEILLNRANLEFDSLLGEKSSLEKLMIALETENANFNK